MLSGAGAVTNLSSKAGEESAPPAGGATTNFAAPAGAAVDAEAAALHGKALAYAEQHKVPYLTAVLAVQRAA